ncbi:MAG TPA: hypothetical protein DDW52_13100 [Planctomycetaceae bacterium]|nr:hypothetical protein [Planctomycetaceae bacterium]
MDPIPANSIGQGSSEVLSSASSIAIESLPRTRSGSTTKFLRNASSNGIRNQPNIGISNCRSHSSCGADSFSIQETLLPNQDKPCFPATLSSGTIDSRNRSITNRLLLRWLGSRAEHALTPYC